MTEAPSTEALLHRLDRVAIRDRERIRRRLESLGEPADLLDVTRSVDEAEARWSRRQASVPDVSYPPDLPVSRRRDEIMAAIRDHQVVVVAGETGSGKTTQLPKMCLELGRGVSGMIGHTQPRRIAARTVAERLADELGVGLGEAVGYAVRFTDRVGADTLVKVMTDGILLAETSRDRRLAAYDTIIVDEAHERSLNIDFLLGYLTRLLPERLDMKVVITSATIDTARFAEHFAAPVIDVSGRTWPVEIRYRPFGDGEAAQGDPGSDPPVHPGSYSEPDLNSAICQAVAELAGTGPGDVLVFLPGERDIRDAADALRQFGPDGIDVLPLYARLSAAEQHRVFRPHRGRRVVLATNVAETSLTVPGIRFVVDSGLARVSRYSHRTKVQRLPIEAVSQASANQRSGRCGRLGPGVCIRLYSEADFASRPEFTDPEILRTNLASVLLQMAAAGLGQIEDFPFLEPPDRRSVADGKALLEELGAFEASEGRLRLTKVGRRLSELPLDPRLARMVVEAERRDCLREVTVIAAALSIQDPRERPVDAAEEAAGMHRRFEVDGSDFLAYVALWDYLAGIQAELSANQFRKRCRAEYLHVLRIREWQDVAGQIRQVARARGITPNRQPADPDRIHQALLAGLLSHMGMRDRAKGDYLGARSSRWMIGRASVLRRRSPPWAMAGELVETERTWARTAARIDPSWAEDLGEHLIKRTWSEPWWDAKRGEAVTEERATLYGLPVVAARTVLLSRTDPVEARAMFIQRGLVDREWPVTVAPLEVTEQRRASIQALEERVRRRDLLAHPDVVARFYESALPPGITGGTSFQRWWRRVGRRHPERLEVPLSVLVDRQGGPVAIGDYPIVWDDGDVELPLRYRYEPGASDDGVTVEIAIEVMNRVDGRGFDWSIPGYRPELIAALIRLLPKAARRALGPAPEAARVALSGCGPPDGPLLEVMAARLSRMSGVPVSPTAWDLDALPRHLRVAFEVLDGRRVLGRGRDLEQLRLEHHRELLAVLARAAPELVAHGLRDWSLGELPPTVARGRLRAYPALVDEGDSVGVALLESPAAQAESMWSGARRLLKLAARLPQDHLERRLTNETRLALARSGQSAEALFDDCATALVEQILVGYGGPPRSEAAFRTVAAEVGRELPDRVPRLATIAGAVLAGAERVLAAVDRIDRRDPNGLYWSSVSDLRAQIDALVHPGFVTEAGPGRMRDLLRYLDAAGRRVERLPSDRRRDAERQSVIARLDRRYRQQLDRAASDPPHQGVPSGLAEIRWMIEELRVSLWAQQLGTSAPVSEARVARALDRLGG